MKQTLSFLYLDFYTVKPYLRNFGLILAIGIFLGFITKSPFAPAMMAMIGFVMVSSYPFLIEEKNGMNTMYATLPVRRMTVVVGRHLFALAVLAAGMIVAYLIALIIGVVYGAGSSAGALILQFLVLYAIGAMLLSLQYPFYFRFGYGKAKFVAMLPLLIFSVGIAVITTFVPDFAQRVMQAFSQQAVAIALLVTGAAAPILSVLISYGLYRGRDL